MVAFVEGFEVGDMMVVLGELVAGLVVADPEHMRVVGDKVADLDKAAEDMVAGLDMVVEDKEVDQVAEDRVVGLDMVVVLDKVVEDKEVGLDKEVVLGKVVEDRVVDRDMVVEDRDKEVGRKVVEDMDLAERGVDLTFILFYINLYVIINLYTIFFKLIIGKFNYNFI